MKIINIKTEKQTKELAEKIAKKLKGTEVLALEGDLGAGKTTFTRYLAGYFGIKRVTSPTFVLMKVFNIKNSELLPPPYGYGKAGRTQNSAIKNIVHVDCYRLDDPQELFYLGLEEYMNRDDTVVIIEWADKIKKYLRSFKKVKWIKIKKGNDSERIFKID